MPLALRASPLMRAFAFAVARALLAEGNAGTARRSPTCCSQLCTCTHTPSTAPPRRKQRAVHHCSLPQPPRRRKVGTVGF